MKDRACVGLLGQVDLLAPVGLEEDAVDLLQVDGFGAVAHGLEQGTEAASNSYNPIPSFAASSNSVAPRT